MMSPEVKPKVEPKIEVTDTACNSLALAAEQLQAYYPDCPTEVIQSALIHWLELSIESLAEDAVFHCVDGRSDIAFNRRAFSRALIHSLNK